MRVLWIVLFLSNVTHAGPNRVLGCTGVKNRQLPWSTPPTLEQVQWARKDKLPKSKLVNNYKECEHILDEIEEAVKTGRKDVDWKWTTSTMLYYCCI